MHTFSFSLRALILALGLFSSALLPAATPSLDLGARVQPASLDARLADPAWHIWCGAPIRGDDGKYHLLYSRWPVKGGFHPGWALRSEIAYAVAERPLGPDEEAGEIVAGGGLFRPPRGADYVPVRGDDLERDHIVLQGLS